MAETAQKRKRRQVDFKALKECADFTAVLYHYKLSLTAKGEELVGNCPFHEDTSGAFSVNIKKGVFHCFGCKAKGSILDFVCKKEGIGVRKAASLLAEICKIELPFLSGQVGDGGSETPDESDCRADSGGVETDARASNEETINPPLTFELKLETEHESVRRLGLSEETIRHFGLGFCSRGLFKDRIAIPIHDEHAALVAYAGRRVEGDQTDGDGSVYKFPDGFKVERIVYNLHRVPECARSVIVVEDFLSVFWLYSCGLPSVVGLPTPAASPFQLGLLRDRFEQIHFFLENLNGESIDIDAGMMALSRQRFVRRTVCPPDMRPYELSKNDVKQLLGFEL